MVHAERSIAENPTLYRKNGIGMNVIERNASMLDAQSVPRLLYVAAANNGKLMYQVS